MDYKDLYLPGDEVEILDNGATDVPEGYYYDGMILCEKKPIHTYIYYVLLKSKFPINDIKVIEVSYENLRMEKYVNNEHFTNYESKIHTVNVLNSILDKIEHFHPKTQDGENTLAFFHGFMLAQRDLEQAQIMDELTIKYGRQNGVKLQLSTTYGEVLNNGKTKQND